ncbi:MAG: PAS domain-containing protein [Desulfobulbaceae bacterium]|nr:PAS domain-containing protein [Desulfobulbaceae bacterium]
MKSNSYSMTGRLLLWLLLFFVLYLISLQNYLVFHSISEIFGVVIACGAFMVTWHCRKYIDNHYLLFIGIAYLFVAFVDFMHTLTYKGMGAFDNSEPNIPTQLWVCARYLESLSLLVAFFFLKKKLRVDVLFFSYLLLVSFLMATIFYWPVFPDCFVSGTGLTPFKKLSEYLICLILLGTIALLLKNRADFLPDAHRMILFSIILTIGAELSFASYVHVYGVFNLLGHFLKILSFYLVYKVIIETALVRPFDLLFRNIKANEEKFRGIYAAMTEGLCLHDVIYDSAGKAQDYRIVDVNPAYESILGIKRQEALNRRASELYKSDAPPYLDIFAKVAATGTPVTFETFFPVQGKFFKISAFSSEKGKFTTVFSDITKRKLEELERKKSHTMLEEQLEAGNRKLENTHAQLLHSEKLSSIGRLAASIAHELNNPLFAIRNVLSGIESRAKLEEEDEELVGLALEECDRIKYLIQDLQNFNRPTNGVIAPMDVHEVIDHITLLLKKEFKNKNITLKKQYAQELPSVHAVEDQIKQVLLNLFNNAVDAIREEGGDITVVTRLHNDRSVAIQIQDSGRGIKPEDMEHIFEPFFTTKPAVKGTGLGLSVSYGIVKNHNGFLNVISDVGIGTTFTLILPLAGPYDQKR